MVHSPGLPAVWRTMLSALITAAVCSCAGDGTGLDASGNPLGSDETSETAATLSGDVQPIFTANCAFAGCHAGSSPVLGQNLSEGLAYGSIVNVPAQEAPGLMRVLPLFPDSSYLVHKIQGTQSTVGGAGGQMPLGADPLSAEEIATIREWIEAGALDN